MNQHHEMLATTRVANHSIRHSQIEANNVWFHVAEQGEGPAVLFLHGFQDTLETWRSQMQAVADNGYRAIALDMRGFGDSYSPADAALYSGAYIVGDLIGIMDALNVPTATIVAHDWGADHGQRAMVMRPDRFKGIVSLSIRRCSRWRKTFEVAAGRSGANCSGMAVAP
jgi:pimeloyl-ACP methyl ester carboxylesterase